MIRLILATALCLSPSLSFAEATDETLGDYDCKVHNPYGQKANRVKWSGSCKDGFAHGTGNLDFDLKKLQGMRSPWARYEGALEAGRMHGQGKLVFVDGTSYIGGFNAGRYDGEGKAASSFSRYEGSWKNGRRHGVGKVVYTLGGSYEGEWEDGEFHGKGVVVYAGGRRVAGDFINGSRVGEAARPPTDRSQRFTGTSDQPVAGRWVWDSAWSAGLPQALGYHQMAPSQQQLVRNAYPLLDDTDEPPYPVDGIANIMRQLANPRLWQAVQGRLRLDVTIDKTGNPVSVKFYPFASATLARMAAKALMGEKYKPALCQGQPCDMVYPFTISYDIR